MSLLRIAQILYELYYFVVDDLLQFFFHVLLGLHQPLIISVDFSLFADRFEYSHHVLPQHHTFSLELLYLRLLEYLQTQPLFVEGCVLAVAVIAIAIVQQSGQSPSEFAFLH